MDLRQHLEEQLCEDFKLLKQLEDKRRFEDDPRQISKWDAAIKEIKQKIRNRESELNSLKVDSSIVYSPPELLKKSHETSSSPKELPRVINKLMYVQPTKAIEVFFSYAQEDEKLRDKLEEHLSLLKREGVITGWHNRKIEAGKEWNNEIDIHLNTAGIILLLVSSAFIASNYCWDVEVTRAMERHEAHQARVIPVIIDSVDWRSAPFGRLQPLPNGGKPVKKWGNRNEAFLSVAQGIRTVVKELAANL